MTESTHVVLTHRVELEADDRDAARLAQSTWLDHWPDAIQPALAAALDAVEADHGPLSLDRVEIELGSLTLDEFATVPERLAEALPAAVARAAAQGHPPTHAASSGPGQSLDMGSQPAADTTHRARAALHLVRHGYRPWWSPDATDEALAEAFVSWCDAGRMETQAELTHALADPRARRRLAEQFGPTASAAAQRTIVGMPPSAPRTAVATPPDSGRAKPSAPPGRAPTDLPDRSQPAPTPPAYPDTAQIEASLRQRLVAPVPAQQPSERRVGEISETCAQAPRSATTHPPSPSTSTTVDAHPAKTDAEVIASTGSLAPNERVIQPTAEPLLSPPAPKPTAVNTVEWPPTARTARPTATAQRPSPIPAFAGQQPSASEPPAVVAAARAPSTSPPKTSRPTETWPTAAAHPSSLVPVVAGSHRSPPVAPLLAEARPSATPAMPPSPANNRFALPPTVRPGERIPITDAGLVLAWPFLPRVFRAQGWWVDDDWRADGQQRAIYWLHHLAAPPPDGRAAEAPTHALIVPKLLCGLPLVEPVARRLTLSAEAIAAADELLISMVAHWPALGSTSPDGLRRAFINREGLLTHLSPDWHLRVQREAHDVLLDRIPWGFGTVRLRWTPYTLGVEW